MRPRVRRPRPPLPRPRLRPRARAVLLATGLLLSGAACARALDDWVAGAVSAPVAAVAARGAADTMPGDPQTLMTRPRAEAPGDRARADSLARVLRASIAAYQDVRAAERAGYRAFPPAPDTSLRIVHYVHRRRSAAEARRVDATRPGALLYEREPSGALRLVGAMVTAPADAPAAELDRRVPLSVTRWHLHQQVCVPRPVWDARAWARRAADGRPAFGPGSPTVTEGACAALGGRFLPTVFGWMAHAYVYAPNVRDPWDAAYGHGGAGGRAAGAGHTHH